MSSVLWRGGLRLERHQPTDVGPQTGGVQRGAQCRELRRAGVLVTAGQLDQRVGGPPVLGDQRGRGRVVPGGHRGDLGALAQPGHGEGDRVTELRVVDGGGVAGPEHDHVGALPAQFGGHPLHRTAGLARRVVEPAPGQLAEHPDAPGGPDGHQHPGDGQHHPPGAHHHPPPPGEHHLSPRRPHRPAVTRTGPSTGGDRCRALRRPPSTIATTVHVRRAGPASPGYRSGRGTTSRGDRYACASYSCRSGMTRSAPDADTRPTRPRRPTRATRPRRPRQCRRSSRQTDAARRTRLPRHERCE